MHSTLLSCLSALAIVAADPGVAACNRIQADAKAGRPLVAHVVVALCDNAHQGIVPVPTALGDGQDPASNLYWGARYGLKTYLLRDGGWTRVPSAAPLPEGMLERLVLRRATQCGSATTAAFLVAEAWDGRRIRDAVDRFLRMAGGHHAEAWRVRVDGRAIEFRAGGGAHVVAYVGHNGLMDFPLPSQPAPTTGALPRSAVVLCCKSQSYFAAPLQQAGAHRLLLTTGFMAPEAYTLDAALKAWLAGKPPQAVHEAAAQAYHRYQRCGLAGARRLFRAEP